MPARSTNIDVDCVMDDVDCVKDFEKCSVEVRIRTIDCNIRHSLHFFYSGRIARTSNAATSSLKADLKSIKVNRKKRCDKLIADN